MDSARESTRFDSSSIRLVQNRPYTVVIEGNIGSGKTTFLNFFKDYSNDIKVLSEPVNKWRNCNGYNLLEKMYSDPLKWSYAFQSYVQLTMLQNHALRSPHAIKVMERSIYSARNCFVEQMIRNDLLEAGAVAVFDEWFKWASETYDLGVDLIVYLRTTPEVAYDRTMKRNRPEEQAVSLDYIRDMHEIHEEWLYHKTLYTCPAPVLVIDANFDKALMENEYYKFRSQIFTDRPTA